MWYNNGDRTIIVLSNNESASSTISGSIANILFHKPVQISYEHKPVGLDSATLKQLAGMYKIKGSEIALAYEKGELLRTYDPERKVKFLTKSGSRVYATDGYYVQYEIEYTDGKTKYYTMSLS